MKTTQNDYRERIETAQERYNRALLSLASALSRSERERESAYAVAIAAKRDYETEIESNFR